MARNEANAKQHLEAERILFEICSHFSSRVSSKINRTYLFLKNNQKNKCVCIHEVIGLIIMKIKVKMKNRSHRYDTNRPTIIFITF